MKTSETRPLTSLFDATSVGTVAARQLIELLRHWERSEQEHKNGVRAVGFQMLADSLGAQLDKAAVEMRAAQAVHTALERFHQSLLTGENGAKAPALAIVGKALSAYIKAAANSTTADETSKVSEIAELNTATLEDPSDVFDDAFLAEIDRIGDGDNDDDGLLSLFFGANDDGDGILDLTRDVDDDEVADLLS